MNLSTEHLHMAAQIDTRVRELERAGANAVTIFTEMADHMPGFRQLMGTTGRGGMDELCCRFAAFYRYAKILENVAAGIQSGEIKVPR